MLGPTSGSWTQRELGNLSLYEKPVLLLANLPRVGALNVGLANPSTVGLLVQRVTGHHRLLGRLRADPEPRGPDPRSATSGTGATPSSGARAGYAPASTSSRRAR